MTLHRCRWKRWGRGKGCAGNRPDREAVRDVAANGGSLGVEIRHWRPRRKVKATSTRVGNASVGER